MIIIGVHLCKLLQNRVSTFVYHSVYTPYGVVRQSIITVTLPLAMLLCASFDVYLFYFIYHMWSQ